MSNIYSGATLREKFLERIKLQGEDEARRIIAEAEAEARRILEEAREKAHIEASREAGKIIKEAEEKASTIRLIAEARARLVYRLRILEEKNKLVENVLEEAKKRLNEFLLSVEYTRILEKFIIEAAIAIGGGNLKIILPKLYDIDLDGIAKIVERETGVKTMFEVIVEEGSFSGGVIVISSDGKLVFDNTFEGRMKRMRKDLIKHIPTILFSSKR